MCTEVSVAVVVEFSLECMEAARESVTPRGVGDAFVEVLIEDEIHVAAIGEQSSPNLPHEVMLL